MLKYLKWICLLLLIICIFITIYLFIDYVEDKKNDDNIITNDGEIQLIYDIKWTRVGFSIYEDGNLIDKKKNLIENNYMTFNSKYIQYCDIMNDKCQHYDYLYKDDKIEIFEDCVLPPGIYNIEFNENELIMSISDDNSEFIYYYESPKG